MVELPPSKPLARVVGENVRDIREAAGVTRNELAKYGRATGLRWTASKVADFENGRNAPTFATILAVTRALSFATRRSVTLPDLVEFDAGMVRLNDKLYLHGWKVQAAARGEPWPIMDDGSTLSEDENFVTLLAEIGSQLSVADIKRRSGLDEQRVARRLGITENQLAAESLRLWGRAFSDERNLRAGPDANNQKRGRTSRILQAELQKALADGNDQ